MTAHGSTSHVSVKRNEGERKTSHGSMERDGRGHCDVTRMQSGGSAREDLRVASLNNNTTTVNSPVYVRPTKTAIECWNILKYVTESIFDTFVPLKTTCLERNTCEKELLEKYCTSKQGFIGLPEWTKTTQITKMHLMKIRMRLDKKIACNI